MTNFKVGVTERGDASVHLDEWKPKAGSVNAIIAITKSVTDELSDFLARPEIKKKTILHATVTGYGGTKLEPNVPKLETSWAKIQTLKAKDFPMEQVVLRIDPMIPTKNGGLQTIERVLETFKDSGISRVRFSFIQFYGHANERLKKIGWPWPRFGEAEKEQAFLLMQKHLDTYTFSSCATAVPERFANTAKQTGCVSEEDLALLGMSHELTGTSNQRPSCLCCSAKTELLSRRQPCKHGCLYCYWK